MQQTGKPWLRLRSLSNSLMKCAVCSLLTAFRQLCKDHATYQTCTLFMSFMICESWPWLTLCILKYYSQRLAGGLEDSVTLLVSGEHSATTNDERMSWKIVDCLFDWQESQPVLSALGLAVSMSHLSSTQAFQSLPKFVIWWKNFLSRK